MHFSEALDKFRGQRILVIGDLMIDEYIFGSVGRISPEAPVMVVHQSSTKRVPGGAANVALNLKALGAEPTILGLAGHDADHLRETLSGLNHQLVVDHSRVTTRKTRVIADGRHQLLRIDHEVAVAAPELCEGELIAAVSHHLPNVDAVLMSDYCKGTLTPTVIRSVIERAGKKPVVVNAKPKTFALYRGASLISLNKAEAAGVLDGPVNEASVQRLPEMVDPTSVLVTLGADGMVAMGPSAIRIRAPKVEVADPAGAGDTVIAAVTLGLATLGFRPETFEFAAQLAARVVQHVGVAIPSVEDLASLSSLESGILSDHAS
jgi:rfaE bifunctional protein kinase chain/domain